MAYGRRTRPKLQLELRRLHERPLFPLKIEAGSSWNTTNFPGICGSKAVDMYVMDGGNNLEVWEHNASPGKLLAKCYRQTDVTIPCGNPGGPLCPTGKTEVHDA